jgi:hypothetical protein
MQPTGNHSGVSPDTEPNANERYLLGFHTYFPLWLM